MSLKKDISMMSFALTGAHFRKTISLEITDEESYEKNLIMYVNIGEPRQIAGTFLIMSMLTILMLMLKSTES